MANRTRSLPELPESPLPRELNPRDWLCVDGIQFDTSHSTDYQATFKNRSGTDDEETRDATRPFSHRNTPFRSLPIDQVCEAAKTQKRYRQGDVYIIFRADGDEGGLFIGANTNANRQKLMSLGYEEETSPPYANHATGNNNVVTQQSPEFLPPPENVQFSMVDRRKHQDFFNRIRDAEATIRTERVREEAAGALRYRFSNPYPPATTQSPTPTPSPQATPTATPNQQASQTSASNSNPPPPQSPTPTPPPQATPVANPNSQPQQAPVASVNPQASQGIPNLDHSSGSSADSGQRRRRRRPRIVNKINIQVSGRDSTFNTTRQNSTPDQSYHSDHGSSRARNSATDDSSFNSKDDSIDGDFEIVRDSSDASSDPPVFVSLPFSSNTSSSDQLPAGDMDEPPSSGDPSNDEPTIEGGHSDDEFTPKDDPPDQELTPEASTAEGAPSADGSNLDDDDELDPYAVLFEDDEPSQINESPEVDNELSPSGENLPDGDTSALDTSPKEASSNQPTVPSSKESSESVPKQTEEKIEELPTGVESLQKKIIEAKKKLKRKDISALTRENIRTELKGWESELKSIKSFISRNKEKKKLMVKERAELRRSKVPTSDPRIVTLDKQISDLTIVINDLLV